MSIFHIFTIISQRVLWLRGCVTTVFLSHDVLKLCASTIILSMQSSVYKVPSQFDIIT